MRGKGFEGYQESRRSGITPAYAGKSEVSKYAAKPAEDHPRVCGEKNCLQLRITEAMGSPPRMRGKGLQGGLSPTACRITPAYAGKRAEQAAQYVTYGDHPRVCGEKGSFPKNVYSGEGSPPRMRGKGPDPQPRDSQRGITPAYAGKRAGACARGASTRDHPRVCGEKSLCCMRWPTRRGSPPRMRGKVCHPHLKKPFPGITPAYAGKRSPMCWRSRLPRDHPRVCGEKFTQSATKTTIPGSPPRMRGKVWYISSAYAPPGITPAYAGKRPLRCATSPVTRDHPRVCGEKGPAMPYLLCSSGSPPRMRGKELLAAAYNWSCGITPAYAGKRLLRKSRTGEKKDHPRVCGEKRFLPESSCCSRGSPPRMRGKVLAALMPTNALGITPAYAGKRLKRSHRIGHFSCILCLFHSVLHRASASGGSRAGPCAPPCLPAQNAVPV